MNNDNVTIKGKKLLKISPKGVFNDNIYLMLSIAHFTNGDYILFKNYIEKVCAKENITAKYCWLSIYYIVENDNAKTSYDAFLELKHYKNYTFYKNILQTLMNITSKSIEIGHNEIKELLVKIKNSRLRSYIMNLEKEKI